MDSIDPILDAGMYPLVIKHGNGKSLFIYIYTYIDFPTRALIYRECSIAMFDYQRVTTRKLFGNLGTTRNALKSLPVVRWLMMGL